jgi:hypothetical protein
VHMLGQRNHREAAKSEAQQHIASKRSCQLLLYISLLIPTALNNRQLTSPPHPGSPAERDEAVRDAQRCVDSNVEPHALVERI